MRKKARRKIKPSAPDSPARSANGENDEATPD